MTTNDTKRSALDTILEGTPDLDLVVHERYCGALSYLNECDCKAAPVVEAARAELAALRDAVAVEREECARIAEENFDLGRQIAAAIRRRSDLTQEGKA